MLEGQKNRTKVLVWLICAALGLGTLACYWPVRHFGFVNYDDPDYVYRNALVQQGLTWPGVRWALQSTEACNWHPMTWLSHMLDCRLYGLNAGGHHLTNVAFHIVNTLLLFLLLKRMTGRMWRGAFVASVFAWHPLHVESVAWISERKDVLSAFFFLLTVWAYYRYVAVEAQPPAATNRRSERKRGASTLSNAFAFPNRRSSWYGLAVGLYALGLMSKPMLVTLPFVLLLLDFWPLQRFRAARAATHGSRTAIGTTWRGTGARALILEKLPFFALALASSSITFWAQKRGGAVAPIEYLTLPLRLEHALVAYACYLTKLVWPGTMAAFYPYSESLPLWQPVGAGLLLLAISLAVSFQARERPYLGVGWFWFVGTLVPVIGLVQVGLQAGADRYTYIPYIGLSIIAAWGVPELLGRSSRARLALAAGSAAVLAACLLIAQRQIKYWQDGVTLFRHAVETTDRNYMAEITLGFALVEQGKWDEAELHHREALRLNPNHGPAHSNLGMILGVKGRLDEAEAEIREAIRLDPRSADAWNNLGKVYLQRQKPDEARALFSKALQLNPNLEKAHYNLGLAWGAKGQWEECAAEFQTAVRLAPDDAEARKGFVGSLVKLGRLEEALTYCQAVARSRPGDPEGYFILAEVDMLQNRPEQGVADLKHALRLAPDNPRYINQLAWVFATHRQAGIRDGDQAVRLAERACALTNRRDAGLLDTLGAAYAEAGRFGEAATTAEEARVVATAANDGPLAAAAAQKLELYRDRKPYREN